MDTLFETIFGSSTTSSVEAPKSKKKKKQQLDSERTLNNLALEKKKHLEKGLVQYNYYPSQVYFKTF